MKKRILFLILVSFSLSAQIKGVVKDSITGKPIPYVGIWSKENDYSLSSDKKGRYTIKKESQLDTFIFFTSKYRTKILKNEEVKGIVYLNLKEDIKFNKRKSFEKFEKIIQNDDLTSRKLKRYESIDSSSVLLAQFIPYLPEYENIIYVKKIQLSVQNHKRNDVYKIRLFESDSTGKPSKEILNHDVLAKTYIQRNSQKYNNKYTDIGNNIIDFENELIVFPKRGLFIAVELMYFKKNDINTEFGVMTNPFLLFTNIKSNNSWKFVKGEWIKKESFFEFAYKLTLTN